MCFVLAMLCSGPKSTALSCYPLARSLLWCHVDLFLSATTPTIQFRLSSTQKSRAFGDYPKIAPAAPLSLNS